MGFSVFSSLLVQVFATYPNEDYDRRNEDVDPMAASAEYELEKRVERLDLFPVELEKGTKRLVMQRFKRYFNLKLFGLQCYRIELSTVVFTTV